MRQMWILNPHAAIKNFKIKAIQSIICFEKYITKKHGNCLLHPKLTYFYDLYFFNFRILICDHKINEISL